MEQLNSGIFLQAADQSVQQMQNFQQQMPTMEKIQQGAQNQLKLQSEALDVKNQQQEQSDSQKISKAMQAVDPNSPTYADDVLKAAQAQGLSGKALLNLKQNLYVSEGEQLKTQAAKLQIQDAVGNMNDKGVERLSKVVDTFDAHLQPLVTDYQQLASQGKANDPAALGVLASRRDASIRDYIGQITDGEMKGFIPKQQGDAQIQQLQGMIGKPYDPKIIQNAYEQSSAWKTELDRKKEAVLLNESLAKTNEALGLDPKSQASIRKDNAEAAAAGRQVTPIEVTNDDGTKSTHLAITDKASGRTVDTGAIAAPKGASAGGGRDSVYTSRIISAGEEALGDAKNAMELPLDSNAGWLSSKKTQDGGIMSSLKSGLANKMTTQDAQNYNVVSSGLQRNLSAIEASGLAPAGSLTHQMDAVVIQPGDSVETSLRKLAQTRQIVENGLKNVLNKPTVNDAQKKEVQGILDGMKQTIPFTNHDITEWKKNGRGQSFNDYVSGVGLGDAPPEDINALVNKYAK